MERPHVRFTDYRSTELRFVNTSALWGVIGATILVLRDSVSKVMRLCYGCYVNFHCGTAADHRAGTGAARTALGELHPNGEEQRCGNQTNLAATFTSECA